MARSFLTEEKLPKIFWFWPIICKANLCLDILLITQKEGSGDPVFMTTTHFECFGTKPDHRVLFQFSSIGAFCRTWNGITNAIILNHNVCWESY